MKPSSRGRLHKFVILGYALSTDEHQFHLAQGKFMGCSGQSFMSPICVNCFSSYLSNAAGLIYHYYHIIFPNAIIIIIIIIIIDTTIVIATVYRNLLTFSSPAFRGWVVGGVGGGWRVAGVERWGSGGAWHSPKPVSFHQPCLIKSVSLCS